MSAASADHRLIDSPSALAYTSRMTAVMPRTVGAILRRSIQPDRGDYSVEEAKAVLRMKLDPSDLTLAEDLAVKARAGALTPEEADEIEAFREAARALDLMHAKARLSLKLSGHPG